MSSPPPTPDSPSDWLLDAVLVPIGLLLLALYNASFYWRVKVRPLSTVVGVNHVSRRAWVRSIMKDIDKKNILAVQTLRNSIMASTLLASTAMLLAGAAAAFVASSSTNASLQSSVSSIVVGFHSPLVVTIKFFLLLLCFIFSFMCHVQSIRYTNHVNFLICIPPEAQVPGLTPDYVASVLARGSNFYTVGTRGFYCAFPCLLWLFGPLPFVVSCALLVVVLYRLDTASGYDTEMHVEAAAATCTPAETQASPVRSAQRHSESHHRSHAAWGEAPSEHGSPSVGGPRTSDNEEQRRTKPEECGTHLRHQHRLDME